MAADPNRRPLTVRVPPSLYEDASDLAALERVPLRQFFERAIQREVERCRLQAGDDIDALLNQVRSYRNSVGA